MITFFSETEFELQEQGFFLNWLEACIDSYEYTIGNVNYIFCDDTYLLEINQQHLNHDTYTDIITFDYTEGNELSGDIFISVERVVDNAHTYETSFENELARVMIHGILHMIGLKDKTEKERLEMRNAEAKCLNLLYPINDEE